MQVDPTHIHRCQASIHEFEGSQKNQKKNSYKSLMHLLQQYQR